METPIVFVTTPEQNRFQTIAEFQNCLICGGEVEFEWNGLVYNITAIQNKIGISHSCLQSTEKLCDTPDEVLEYMVGKDRLRDVITQVKVLDRTI